MTDASVQALSVLRSTDNLQWYIIPLLVFVFYIYFVEIEKKNWSPVLLGLAFWATEFIWEMFNALILHFTEYSALWTTPGELRFCHLCGPEYRKFLLLCGLRSDGFKNSAGR